MNLNLIYKSNFYWTTTFKCFTKWIFGLNFTEPSFYYKKYKLHDIIEFISYSKKFDINRLPEFLSVLDSDEGIRIKDLREGKTFFINRNLFGTYNILVRIKKEIHKEPDNIPKKTDKTIQEFYRFNEMNQVKKFITENSNSQDIWIY